MSLYEQYKQNVLETYAPPKMVFAKGEGSYLFDTSGKAYVDFGGGIAVLSLGHCPPVLSEAIAKQAKTLMHLSNLHINEPVIHLAQCLCDNTFAERVFFCNSGAEANEAAIKIARKRGIEKYPEKYHVLSFSKSFHGRLGFSMAATGQEKISKGFGPLAPGFRVALFNDCQALEQACDESLCAIIVEPIQGEGGINKISPAFLLALQQMAIKYDALLIFDEIQCGAGRTGSLYTYMQSDVAPDLLTSAKGLGCGFPVGAVLIGEKARDVLSVGSHGTTYGGNALAATAALTVLKEILSEGFFENVVAQGLVFRERLEALKNRYQCFGEIRQYGLLIGCDTTLPLKDVIATALEEGLIVLSAGTQTLRLTPALNISTEAMDTGFNRLEKTLQRLTV